MKKSLTYLLIPLLAFFNQCATSRITGTWKGTDIHPERYKKILVLAVIRGPDSVLQASMEKNMAAQLVAHDQQAISAIEHYGTQAFVALPRDTVRKILYKDNINAVLTIVLRDKSKEIYDVTGKVLFSLYPFRENDFWLYYSAMNEYHPVFSNYTEHTDWFWESNFYDVTSGSLVYSIQTASLDPISSDELANSYASVIVKNLVRNKVLPPAKHR